MPVLLPSVATALAGAVTELVELDVHDLPDASLLSLYERIGEAEAQLAAAKARLLRAADVRDATVTECGRASRSWLIEELRLGSKDASRQLQLARWLPTVPLVEAALGAGDIHLEHATMILALLRRGVPDALRGAVEEELVGLAKDYPPYVLAQLIREILGRLGLDEDADERAARRYAERGIDRAKTFDGYGSLSATLSPELYEKLDTAFAATGAAHKGGPEDDRSTRQRDHDALEEIIDYFLGTAPLPDDNGERPRIVVTIDYQTLLGDLTGRWGLFDSGAEIPPQTIRRLACDAQILPVVLGSNNVVLDMGALTPTFSSAVKRAAKIRDGGRCAFPWCSRRVAECHHIEWLSRGGKSTVDNAAWLCAFHHWLIHNRGWSMRRDPNGGYTWNGPASQEISGDPPPRRSPAA